MQYNYYYLQYRLSHLQDFNEIDLLLFLTYLGSDMIEYLEQLRNSQFVSAIGKFWFSDPHKSLNLAIALTRAWLLGFDGSMFL